MNDAPSSVADHFRPALNRLLAAFDYAHDCQVDRWRPARRSGNARSFRLGDPAAFAGRSHPCFAQARLTALPTLVSDSPGNGRMTGHGTHIASMLFGNPESQIRGIVPACRGLIAPIFSDERQGPTSPALEPG